MPLYCATCNNLLVMKTSIDSFSYACDSCKIKYNPEPENTLCYEENKVKTVSFGSNLLLTASKDPMNPKVYHKCKNCNNSGCRNYATNLCVY